MIVELYEALKPAGAPEEKAQATAKALARPDDRFDRVDADLAKINAEIAGMKVELATVRAELGTVKWMVGGVGFGVLPLVLRSFVPGT